MTYKIKLRKRAIKSYDIIVVKKKSGFYSKVFCILGRYTYVEGLNMTIARVNKKDLSKWLLKGATMSERVSKIINFG